MASHCPSYLQAGHAAWTALCHGWRGKLCSFGDATWGPTQAGLEQQQAQLHDARPLLLVWASCPSSPDGGMLAAKQSPDVSPSPRAGAGAGRRGARLGCGSLPVGYPRNQGSRAGWVAQPQHQPLCPARAPRELHRLQVLEEPWERWKRCFSAETRVGMEGNGSRS